MRESAIASGKTLEEYIQKFIDATDADFARQGNAMQLMHVRERRLSKALLELQRATVYAHPFIFLAYLDKEIALSTMHAFEPGIALTMESLCYVCLGILVGYLTGICLINPKLRSLN